MTDLDVTTFVLTQYPQRYAANAVELGVDAGAITWNAAVAYATTHPDMLGDAVDDWKQEVRSLGAWTDDECASWPEVHWVALFVQFLAGDMREAGLYPGNPPSVWAQYYDLAAHGRAHGRLDRTGDGRIIYSIGG